MQIDATSPLRLRLADLHADRERLRAAVERVPAALRTRRPAPDRWSVAEVLEHVATVEGHVAAVVGALAARAPAIDAATAGAQGSRFLDRAPFRDRSRRVAAPEMLHPAGGHDADAAWRLVERSRAALLDAIASADGRDLGAVQRPHPFLGPLDGYQWIDAVGGHEERHTGQIDEIAAAFAADGARPA